jgi:hypothetical protein
VTRGNQRRSFGRAAIPPLSRPDPKDYRRNLRRQQTPLPTAFFSRFRPKHRTNARLLTMGLLEISKLRHSSEQPQGLRRAGNPVHSTIQ